MAKKAKEETVTNGDKGKAFDDLIAELDKQYSPGTVQLLGSTKRLNVETSSSGSMVVDSILGGGLVRGRVHEIYGPEASGKTSLALTAIANIQRNGGNAMFIDAEHALDPRYARVLGVDTDRLAIASPSYAEQALNIMNSAIESGVVDIVVLDSVAALVPKKELEGDMEQNTVGLMARTMGQALRKITPMASKTKTIVIFINQTREKVGVFFGSPETTPGGKALKFYASQRIRISRVGQLKEGSKIIGNKVKVKCVKNKIAPPYGEGETVITFNHGIHQEAELLILATDLGYIVDSRKSFSDKETGEKLARGQANMVDLLSDRSNGLYDKYHDLVWADLNSASMEKIAEKLSGDKSEDKSEDNDTEESEDTETK
jgi:recombination protein RecA